MRDFDIIVAFRDRGNDPCRAANFNASLQWWRSRGINPIVVDDGRSGSAMWNRSAAYNRGARASKAEVLCYVEADLLIPANQLYDAVRMATQKSGLVVPFSRFMAMIERDSEFVRSGVIAPAQACAQQVRGVNESTGAANVVSRETLEMVGAWDEQFDGAWFDDSSMQIAFEVCCGPVRFVDGPGYHMWHVPGVGEHVTPDEAAATERNRQRFELYKQAKTPEDIRNLTLGSV